jgi:hypothetical protein
MLYAKINASGHVIDVAPYQDDEYNQLVSPHDPFVADILAAKLDQAYKSYTKGIVECI